MSIMCDFNFGTRKYSVIVEWNKIEIIGKKVE